MKPREFWIKDFEYKPGNNEAYFAYDYEQDRPGKWVHVIEFEAFASLNSAYETRVRVASEYIAENEALRKERDELGKALASQKDQLVPIVEMWRAKSEECDAYRAALETIKFTTTAGDETTTELECHYLAEDVLAKFPSKESK